MEKHIQDQLMQSILFEMSEYAIFIMDTQGTIQSWNLGAKRIKQYTEEEIVGKNFRIFYTDEAIRDRLPDKLIQTAIEENRAIDEGWRVRKDGSRFWASVVITTVHDDAGNIIGFTKITRDLTEQKQAKERFRNIIENAPDAILIIDRKGVIQMLNRQTESVFGYTKEELEGQHMEKLMPNKEKRVELLRKLVTPFKDTSENDTCIDCCGLRKDGKEVPVEISISPLIIDEIDSQVIVVIRDITEKKQLVNDIIEAKQKAEESNRLKSAFLATMNHELRTPLSHILGLSDIILDTSQNEEVLEYSSMIKHSGENLLKIIDNIFNLANMEHGSVKIHSQTMHMSNFYMELKTLSETILSQSNKSDCISLDFNVYDETLLFKNIVFDKYKVYQVITNLVNNAIKYTEEGIVTIGLYLLEGDSIAVSVEDTGMGIPYDKQKAIFEFFRQADDTETRVHGGIGVGLTIADRIAHILGGKIHLYSKPGKGSNFTFVFPFNIDENLPPNVVLEEATVDQFKSKG